MLRITRFTDWNRSLEKKIQGSDHRKRKDFQRHDHGTADLAVPSEIIRCSYITRPHNFFQGQEGDGLNKITGQPSLGELDPSNSQLSEVGVQDGGLFVPREDKFRRGAPTYHSNRGMQPFYNASNNPASERLGTDELLLLASD